MYFYLIPTVTQSVAIIQDKASLGRLSCAPPRQNQEGKLVRKTFSFGQKEIQLLIMIRPLLFITHLFF